MKQFFNTSKKSEWNEKRQTKKLMECPWVESSLIEKTRTVRGSRFYFEIHREGKHQNIWRSTKVRFRSEKANMHETKVDSNGGSAEPVGEFKGKLKVETKKVCNHNQRRKPMPDR